MPDLINPWPDFVISKSLLDFRGWLSNKLAHQLVDKLGEDLALRRIDAETAETVCAITMGLASDILRRSYTVAVADRKMRFGGLAAGRGYENIFIAAQYTIPAASEERFAAALAPDADEEALANRPAGLKRAARHTERPFDYEIEVLEHDVALLSVMVTLDTPPEPKEAVLPQSG
jgi:hypothetical protein